MRSFMNRIKTYMRVHLYKFHNESMILNYTPKQKMNQLERYISTFVVWKNDMD